LIEYEIDASGQRTDETDGENQETREERRANHVHKETVSSFVGFVERLMHQRIIENEQLIFAPVVCLVPDSDVR
jgi:hypothetical protein